MRRRAHLTDRGAGTLGSWGWWKWKVILGSGQTREVTWPVLIAKNGLDWWNKTVPRIAPVLSELVILMRRC